MPAHWWSLETYDSPVSRQVLKTTLTRTTWICMNLCCLKRNWTCGASILCQSPIPRPPFFHLFLYEPRCEANMDKMACVAYSSPWLKDQTWKVHQVSNMCPIDFWFHLVVVFNPSDKYSSIRWSSTTFAAGFHQAFRKASWVPCFQNSNQGLTLSQLQTYLSKSTENFTCGKNVCSFKCVFSWMLLTLHHNQDLQGPCGELIVRKMNLLWQLGGILTFSHHQHGKPQGRFPVEDQWPLGCPGMTGQPFT